MHYENDSLHRLFSTYPQQDMIFYFLFWYDVSEVSYTNVSQIIMDSIEFV